MTLRKITTNFSDDVNFLHAFYLKFTINANIVYIPVKATFSTSILCFNRHGQYFNSWSVAALSVS